MRKTGILLQIFIMVPLLTGCWSRVEVNDISIVTAAAIDKVEGGKIRVTLQIAIPIMLGQIGGGSGGGDNNKSTAIVSEKGETVMDAYSRLQEKLPRRLFFSHSRIIIIGENIARDGVSSILDFFSRYREARLRSYILFAKGEAADILKISTKWERISAEEIREEEKARTGMSIYLKDFLDMLLTEGVEPIAAQVQPKLLEVKVKDDSKYEEPLPMKEMNVAITGAAVFHKDKLVGWLSDKETRGVIWLRNELKTGVIIINIPKEKGGGKISAQLLKATTLIKPKLVDNEIKINVEVRTEDNLYENSTKLDLNNPNVIEYVQKELESVIKERIQLAIDKMQKKFKSDVFGFGSAVNRTYPKEWQKKFKNAWDEEFPNLDVSITPHVTVTRIGLTNKPLIWEEKEFVK